VRLIWSQDKAHARRYFVEAVKANDKDTYALDFVRRIDELFAVDREAREAGVSLETRAEWRRVRSTGIVEGIKARLEAKPGGCIAKKPDGKGGAVCVGAVEAVSAVSRVSGDRIIE
jgi:hypothetical protein